MDAQITFWQTWVLRLITMIVVVWVAWNLRQALVDLSSKSKETREEAQRHILYIAAAAFVVLFFGIDLTNSSHLSELGNWFVTNGIRMGGGGG